MSSGTMGQPGVVRRLLSGVASRLGGNGNLGSDDRAARQNAAGRIARLGLTPRQQALNHLWAWYRSQHYDARKVDWNGQEVLTPIEHESVATAGFLPAGFYDAQSLPLKFRRPRAPYALVKVVVDRFTGLLFSERHHPTLRVEGDPATEDYSNALAEEARLWPAMLQARAFGGAMGTFVLGFQFLDGKPAIEVHDPRWCFPEFSDRSTLELAKLEKRYIYEEEVKDQVTGISEPVAFWYRRVIDTERDVLFKPAPVGSGDEPEWQVEREVVHGFGFHPCVWGQNLPLQDDIDGDPDCLGIYDLVEAIDALYSQANKGTLASCDPTVVIASDVDMAEVLKGSDNAIKLPSGSSAAYMEITGSGLKTAVEIADRLREHALEVAQCVLEHPEMSQRTATEIERVYSSMLSKADILREQYGEKGIKPLLNKMIMAVQKLESPVAVEGEGVVRQMVKIPARVVEDASGNQTLVQRRLGPGGSLGIQWPHYFEPMLTDVELAARSAGAAKLAGLLDIEHAAKFVAQYFGVRNVQAMLKRIEAERKAQVSEAEQSALKAIARSY